MPAPLVRAEPRFWFNPEIDSRDFLIPGSVAIIMTLIGTLLTALVVAREWERGTMEALMATPVGAVEFLLGKLIPYFVLGMAAMALSVVVAVAVFGVPFRGSVGALVAISSVFLAAMLPLGLLISTMTRNQFVASQAALIAGFLPAFELSGFIFEIDSMPAADPAAHATSCRRATSSPACRPCSSPATSPRCSSPTRWPCSRSRSCSTCWLVRSTRMRLE